MNSFDKTESNELIEKAIAQRRNLSEVQLSAVREFLTKRLEIFGPHKFALIERFREPKNAREQNLLDCYSECDDTLSTEIIRRFAERQIDLEMLEEYHSHVVRQLEILGSFFESVITAANQCDKGGNLRDVRSQETEAHNAFLDLQEKSEMYTSEIMTCIEFLSEMNTKHGKGVVEFAETSANSWHEFVLRISSFICEIWNSCCEISSKSRNRDEYAYQASASSLFVRSTLGGLPRPQQLYARVVDEFLRAKQELEPEEADPIDELNHIEILEPINSGLYGRVYKGIQKNLDRIVAIKIIKESGKRTADVIAHAKLLTRTQHQALVTVHAVQLVYIPDLSKRVPSIVMEWLEGQTFADRLSSEEFSVEQAIMLSQDVIDGIAELHRVGLCHGDLHVGNVIVLNNGHGKIIDIDANKETSLSRMSLQSREAAKQSDIDYCRGIIFKTLRRSTIPLSRLDDLEGELTRATTLDALRTVANLFGQAGS